MRSLPSRHIDSIRNIRLNTLLAVAWAAAFSASTQAATPEPAFQPTEADQAALKQAIETGRRNDLVTAQSQLNDLVVAHPAWAEAKLWRGRVRIAVKDFNGAVDDLTAVVEAKPTDAQALLNLAAAQAQSADPASCFATLDKLLVAHPDDGDAAIFRIEQFITQNRPEDAAHAAKQLLSKVTGTVRPAFLARVVPLQQLAGDYAGADAGATELLKIVQNAQLYAARADSRRGLKRYDDAKADLQAGLTANGGRPDVSLLFVSSQIMFDTGDFSSAIVQLADVLEFTPADPKAESAMARAVVARHEAARAKSGDLVPPLSTDTVNSMASAWEFRAILGNEEVKRSKRQAVRQWSAGDFSPARAVCDKAIALYPDAQLYRLAAMSTVLIDLAQPADAPATSAPSQLRRAAEQFQIAAGLYAVAQARDPGSTESITEPPGGNLGWAEFALRRADGKPSDEDAALVRGYEAQLHGDYLTAVRAYSASDKSLLYNPSGPAYTLRATILDDTERLQLVVNALGTEIQKSIESKNLSAAETLTKEMQHLRNASPPEVSAFAARIARAQGDRTKADAARAASSTADRLCPEAHLMDGEDLEAAGKIDEAMLEYNFAANGQREALEHDAPGVGRAIAARDRLEAGYTVAKLRELYAARADAALTAEQSATAFVLTSRLKYGFEPTPANVFGACGTSASQLGLYRASAADLQQALQLDPKGPWWERLADSRLRIGETEKAIAALGQAIDLQPTASLHLQRARASYEADDLASAADDLRACIKLGVNGAEISLLLAECVEGKNPKEAAALEQEVLKMPVDTHQYLPPPYAEMAKARLYLLSRTATEKH